MPFFLTILATHQAFAPSRPMPLPRKSRSVRVEFCSRASAKAWHGEKWLQKVHEAQIIKISKTKFQAEKPDQTIGGPWRVAHQWCTMLICSSFEFELLTSITRLSLKIFSHCDVNDSLATWEINKNTLCIFCIKFLSAHWLHFQGACILLLAKLCPFFSHHPHQTPSLRAVLADVVVHQIQVDQSRALFERLGQGLTGEIWTMSAALELIKFWVLSVLPSFLRICQVVEPLVSIWNTVSFIFLHLSHQVCSNLIKNSPQEISWFAK